MKIIVCCGSCFQIHLLFVYCDVLIVYVRVTMMMKIQFICQHKVIPPWSNCFYFLVHFQT